MANYKSATQPESHREQMTHSSYRYYMRGRVLLLSQIVM